MPAPEVRGVRGLRPDPVPGVAGLAPYQQGKQTLRSGETPIKLSSNESNLGSAPSVVDAFHAAAAALNRYPDGGQVRLREAIAQAYGLDRGSIVCGNGSDEVISLVMRCYVRPGDHVVISQHSFAMAFIHAAVQGATIHIAEEPNLRPDADCIMAKVTPETRMVVLATPNNPVGQYIAREELVRLRDALSPGVVLLIDAAYGDYVLAADYESGAALVEAAENVIMTRTFSKIHGLAGLRVGWGYMPRPMLEILERVRSPFNVNAVAMAAAEAAVRDAAFVTMVKAQNRAELDRLAHEAGRMGVEVIPSVANFYLLRFAGPASTPEGAALALETAGVIPRRLTTGGPEGCLRITVGTPRENDAVLDALRGYMAATAGPQTPKSLG